MARSPVLPGNTSSPTTPYDGPVLLMKAMAEAMDTEIGRLLASMDPAVRAITYVIVLGDSGTNGPSVSPPWDPAKTKSTMYEGGVNVPLIIAGPTVAVNQESTGLVHVADLFAILCEIADADAGTAMDATSFAVHLTEPALPTSPIVYGERFRPNGFGPWNVYEQIARDSRFKFWRFHSSAGVVTEHLYDLITDPFETMDLLLQGALAPGAQAAFDQLSAYVDALD